MCILNCQKITEWQTFVLKRKRASLIFVLYFWLYEFLPYTSDSTYDIRFRWTSCQLDSLRKSIRLPMLRKTLHSLPKSLDETYLRILENIDDDYLDDVGRLLRLLAVFVEELSVKQAAEFIAIDFESDTFDINNRFRDPWELFSLCGSLLSITTEENADDGFEIVNIHQHDSEGEPITRSEHESVNSKLRLAHYSVKEFLLSSRLRDHPAATKFGFDIEEANGQVARACLSYLAQLSNADKLSKEEATNYPALEYSVEYALAHASRAGKHMDDTLERLVWELLNDESEMYPAFRE